MSASLTGKRVLVTQAGDFMGPVLCEVLAARGAEVVPSTVAMFDPASPAEAVRAAGHVDVLVANLAIPAPSTPAPDVSEDEWREVFAALVDPLPRLAREDAEFAAYLCSDAADCFVGQVFPVCGGWVPR
jgi:2-keto-3-deoxy-L-fuconate dehydrogenase